jgi:hypothetical protein
MNLTSPAGSVPITDPTLTANPATLVLTRFRYFEAPNQPATTAATIDTEARTPTQTNVSSSCVSSS